MAIYKAVRDQSIADGDRQLEARALAHFCQTSVNMQKLEEGFDYGLRAISLAREIEEWATLGRTLQFFGYCAITLGIAKENIQTHGGMGFTWEFDCQFPYRRSKLLAINIGSEAVWQEKLIQAIEKDRAA